MKRLVLALAALAGLGLLSWFTLDDLRIRLVTLAILGMFAVKTLVRRRDVLAEDEDGEAGDRTGGSEGPM